MALDLNVLKENSKRIFTEEVEVVRKLPIADLHTFKDHPFHVRDDEEMDELVALIKEIGVTTPIIVRKREKGGYEIVSGHRRTHASQRAGETTIGACVRDLTDDQAQRLMLASNHQRHCKPTEWADAYTMRLETIKKREGTEARAVSVLAAEEGIGEDKVYRYIRIARLIAPLRDMVDDGSLLTTPAAQLSVLDAAAQQAVVDAIHKTQCPTMEQAKELRRFYTKYNVMTVDDALDILQGKKMVKKAAKEPAAKINYKAIKTFFPKGTKEADVLGFVQMLLEDYAKEHGQDGVIKL